MRAPLLLILLLFKKKTKDRYPLHICSDFSEKRQVHKNERQEFLKKEEKKTSFYCVFDGNRGLERSSPQLVWDSQQSVEPRGLLSLAKSVNWTKKCIVFEFLLLNNLVRILRVLKKRESKKKYSSTLSRVCLVSMPHRCRVRRANAAIRMNSLIFRIKI